MKVQMTDVTTYCRVRQANLSVEIRTIQIDLAAMIMNNLASFHSTIFKNTER